jgi:hypothetical protein
MKIRKIVISVAAIALLAGAASAAQHEIKKQKKQAVVDNLAQELVQLAGITPEMSFDQKGDAARAFLQKNSRHDTDEEFERNWRDEPKMMRLLAARARDPKTAPLPPMECSTRSATFVRMMHVLGYQSHSIALYKIDPKFKPGDMKGEQMISHTFTETWNPGTKRWQVMDPDLDLFWRRKKDHVRAGAEELMASPLDAFEPCRSETDCGYNRYEDRKAKTYLSVISIRDRQNGRRPLIVNTSRFPFDKPFMMKGKLATYCEHIRKNCREDIRIYSDDKTVTN